MADMPDYHTYVVPVTVSIPVGESPIGDVAKYQASPAALTDGDRGPLLIDQHGRLYVIVYGAAEVDHAKIKGVALKDPTTAESVPVSIESPAIAYDVGNDVFKVHAIVSGAAIDPRQIRDLVSNDVVTVVQATAASLKCTVTQADSERSITREGTTWTHFSETTSGEILAAPGSGKALEIVAFIFSSSADIVTSLRFGSGGDDMFPLQTKGAVGMNFVGVKAPRGGDNANLYAYLSAAGTMKGSVCTREVTL